ncbi:hypothetical protein SAMN05421734_10223 [Pelagirhabdus alkalitolerans]|uniref:DUF6884 domain-containing protein n=1 Tax=Pelagirhabdus alkalitolerans TaxID=1612202 RepID=A0A1G6GXX8_9BACI|nr:hypothetical protein SAMN05421734_10223 [Pelagirhabdus alkalitolerans]
MKTLAILPCGKRKIWDKYPYHGSAKVKDVYIGNLHRLTRGYAEQFATDWVILSAKHGFRSRNEIIKENYDLTFGMKNDGIISNEALKKQIKEKQLDQYDKWIVLTGQKHLNVLRQIVDLKKLNTPLLGTRGIGDMQKRLKCAIDNKRPLPNQYLEK